MSEDNLIDLGSSSSAASSYSPSEVKRGSVEVTPRELHFFNGFEQENNILKHNIAIMNTTSFPVIITVLCSHPSLVHALKLDNVRVEPQSKVQSRVVQHPPCRLPRLALLQIVTWTSQHQRIVSRHYIPIYINCRPSRETFENIRHLKTRLSKCLKNAVIVSLEDVSTQRNPGSATKHLRRESDLTSSNKELFRSSGAQNQAPASSELNDRAILERRLQGESATRQLDSCVTRSYESIARISSDMHEALDGEFDDAADSLLSLRGLSSSDNRLPTRSNVGSRDALHSEISTGSSGSPSSTHLVKRSVEPRHGVPQGRSDVVQPPTFDPSEEPYQFNHGLSETSYSRPSEFRNVLLTSNEIAARMRKVSNKDEPRSQSKSAAKGASGNDVLVCWCVIALAGVSMATSWWHQEFDFFQVFSLSPVVQKTLLAFAVVFMCFGYLLKCFCS